MGRRQEAGERSPTRQKINVFDKQEQRKLACYAERTTDDKPSAEKACILCRGAKEEDRRSTDERSKSRDRACSSYALQGGRRRSQLTSGLIQTGQIMGRQAHDTIRILLHMEYPLPHPPRTYQWQHRKAEAPMGGEAAHDGIRPRHKRFPLPQSGRHIPALHALGLYRGEDGCRESHREGA